MFVNRLLLLQAVPRGEIWMGLAKLAGKSGCRGSSQASRRPRQEICRQAGRDAYGGLTAQQAACGTARSAFGRLRMASRYGTSTRHWSSFHGLGHHCQRSVWRRLRALAVTCTLHSLLGAHRRSRSRGHFIRASSLAGQKTVISAHMEYTIMLWVIQREVHRKSGLLQEQGVRGQWGAAFHVGSRFQFQNSHDYNLGVSMSDYGTDFHGVSRRSHLLVTC